ncbi:MAG: chemotaxis protein CheD [Desulfobacteraceae bacterium]|nr:chemotaxis protein CheD [Desulfobacteraceae bacterium]
MKLIVGVADMKVSNDPGHTLVTYSLGSCIGLVVFDPVAGVGGILHYMLPESSIDRAKAAKKPFMFADTGIPRLFKETYKYDAKKSRMNIFVVGGAQIMDQQGFFNIGKRNYMALKKMFFKNRVMVTAEDVGGHVNRTVHLDINTGEVFLKASGARGVKL